MNPVNLNLFNYYHNIVDLSDFIYVKWHSFTLQEMIIENNLYILWIGL